MSINKKEFNLEQVVKLCVVVNISLFLFVAFMLTLFVYFNIKLVDCLEKCLICRHIRRFAD